MERLFGRFYLAFLYEDRWRFYVDGFLMTMLLTLASFVLGTLVGALLCAMKLSRIAWLRRAASLFVSFLVQLPTMVLLMFFVYIIFGSTPLSVVTIVIMGLTLKAGAYIADICCSALTAVPAGEQEAAHALGMTPIQVFFSVTLPQAISFGLPVYQNQYVITLQETSVVGYLAIVDLTRASDIVTSRTLDAIFGLVSVSILYLLIGYTGNRLLGLLGRRKHLGGNPP